MNIFADYHHDALMTSLYMLFEGRLGHKLYRPIGMDWWHEGYWAINELEDTAKQYLEIRSTPGDGTRGLNDAKESNEYYEVPGLGSTHKAVTVEQFANMDIDVVIASIPQHILPFKRLIERYHPDAKLVLQIGNDWDFEHLPVENVLASIAPRSTKKHAIFYHQEFSRDIFKAVFFTRERIISTFINVLREKPRDYELFMELERLLPNWEFRMYGAQNRDGNISTLNEIALRMSESKFLFHCKTGGDGFGHVLWSGASCGVSLITRMSDYRGKLGESIMDDSTCIFVDGKPPEQIAMEIADKEKRAMAMGWNIYEQSLELCDFDSEQYKIDRWLQTLR